MSDKLRAAASQAAVDWLNINMPTTVIESIDGLPKRHYTHDQFTSFWQTISAALALSASERQQGGECIESAYREGFNDAQTFKNVDTAWSLSVSTHLAPPAPAATRAGEASPTERFFAQQRENEQRLLMSQLVTQIRNAITDLEDGDTDSAADTLRGLIGDAPQAPPAAPSRSQRMRDAGFTARDTRLECDECGGKFTAQMLPVHKCDEPAAPSAGQGEAIGYVAQSAVEWLKSCSVDGKVGTTINRTHTEDRPVPIYTQPAAPVVRKSLSASVADALRPFLSPGQKVIWREPFRWFDDDGVLSNHYDGMSVTYLAQEFGYEVIHDCECAAVIAAAPKTGGANG